MWTFPRCHDGNGQGIIKETAGFGSCVLKMLLLLSPNIGLEASQDCFGEKSQVGNLLKHSECSSMKIRKPSPVIICTHEPSMFFFVVVLLSVFKNKGCLNT